MIPAGLLPGTRYQVGIYLRINLYCSSGVDVIGMLQALGVSEKIIEPLRNSKAGYVALTYALYKIATPLRYTVTLGKTFVLFSLQVSALTQLILVQV